MALVETFELQAPAAAVPERRFRGLRVLIKKKIGVVAIVYIAVFYLAGIFAPLLPIHDPYAQPVPLTVELRNAGPSSEHWFGTDATGRDIFARVIYATRTTLLITLVITLTGGLFLGLGLGLLGGYRGGWVDTVINRVGEVLSGIPTLILLLAIAASFRSRILQLSFDLADNTPLSVPDARAILQFLVIVIATLPFAWLGSSRLTRSLVLSIREQPYVLSAEAVGGSTWRILTRHVLPGVIPFWLLGVTSGMAGIALTEVSLSFLGLGIDPPTASFGSLIADGAGPRTFQNNPHLLLAPTIPIVLFFLAWNLLGDALNDVIDPRSQRQVK